MVAISMYRGNLHRVPDVPRRWPIPPHTLHLRRFKSLLSRRSSSLSRLSRRHVVALNPPSTPSTSAPPSDLPRLNTDEITKAENMERKRELEEKLGALNEKKHYLVQMLKQILNAEEEMKRRIMMQSAATRSSHPPAEASLDPGSAARHAMPKLSVDVSNGFDPGVESESISNQHPQGHLPQVPGASPLASVGRPFHGSFQRNLTFQSPRSSSISGMVNTQLMSTASPRMSSAQQGMPGTHL